MLVALIRPVEVRTVSVEGEHIPDMRNEVITQMPEGWDLINAPVSMARGGARKMEATFQRFDELREIEAEDMDALIAKVPEGWMMLSVRRA
ncbi:hypothetical protein HD600_002742 [Microbacterium ginsengiterrae]|jgi:hypothetical protein|uniref:Uncharacterized protein n=1 Tax=Microbacterium ginsengiterrae TaxID=546115 RepID=A0A7W9CEN7_9MICO|nr:MULTISPECIES: hypothetical protein [Microbacterium]MBB5744245.1 hypothetical protein [Microbacterium ginsengiterrae]